MAIGRIPEPGTGIPESIVDAKGDIVTATAADTPARLAVGTNDHRLVAASGEATGLKYVADTQNTVVDAKGDLLVGTAADTIARLAVGTNGYTLVADSSVSPTGLKWAAPSAGALTKITSATFSNVADTGTTFDAVFTSTYKNYLITFFGIYGSVNEANFNFRLRNAGSTTTTAYYGNNVVGVTKTDTSNAAAFNVGKVRDGSTQQMCLTMTFNRSNNRVGWSYYGWERVSNYSLIGGGFNDSIVADGSDGFILSASSGNIYGTVTVYGLEA